MKITIIGPSGGGKSTLSRKISAQFNIPRFEIDRVWFKHGGHEHLNGCTLEQKEIISQKILAEIKEFLKSNPKWVFDGTYSRLQPVIAEQADVVVLIRRPLLTRIFSHIKRVLQGDNRHPEISTFSDLGFIKTIIKRWRKDEDAKLEDFSRQYESKLITLRSFREVDIYFESLKHKDEFKYR